MYRRDFVRSAFAVVPVIGLVTSGRGSTASETAVALLHRYKIMPTERNARAVTEVLPRGPSAPLSVEFTDAVDVSLSVLKDRIQRGDPASAELAFRLHSAVWPGGVMGYLNYVIGTYIRVEPEHFLELLAAHPHLSGNGKILLNLGLDYVDDFDAQEDEILRRIRAVESVKRDDLATLQREVVEILYSGIYRGCSR
jgi:hypothetical protein